ncbi:hypothetical protein LTR08_009263 [Meristemomyces frigidus]|nr:hypothetical protein LTR08_009263 [Meristemomyces frigidus]
MAKRTDDSNSPGSSEPVNSQIDFQFLNFSHPSDAKASRARRTVRSHVTRRQHAQETKLQAARKAQSYHGTPAEPEQPPPALRRHAVTLPSEKPPTLDLSSNSKVAASRTSSPEGSSSSPSPTASTGFNPQQCIDPSMIYDEEWRPDIPHIMDHYLSNLAVDIPDVDAATVTGLLRTQFFPFVMTDAAPLHAVMLLATSHYGRARGSRSHAIDLLQLRGMAIGEINSALEDPRRATSDQLITAVAKMASYEALFGDRDIFNTHMTGLMRMVTLRGGLPQLGLNGLLERVLLWIDSNATYIVGTHLYFDKAAFPTSAVHPRPDPQRFTGGLGRQ